MPRRCCRTPYRHSRIGAGPWLHVNDADFENVARLGAADIDRPGADMHAEPFAEPLPSSLPSTARRPASTPFFSLVHRTRFRHPDRLDHALGIVVR